MSDFVTVVSGVPRSGTSVVMQMLAAGGIEPLADGRRKPDADNPRGYFEHSGVKSLRGARAVPSWWSEAPGRAVKVIHALVSALPSGFAYRVLFVVRDFEEILASQRAMLERSGAPPDPLPDERWIEIWRDQLEFAQRALAERCDASALSIHHADLIADPLVSARRIESYLGRSLDTASMAAAVDPALHRRRRQSTGGGGSLSSASSVSR